MRARSPVLIVTAVLAAGALLLAVKWLGSSRPATQAEVETTALELRDGRLCLKGQTNPYTGVMVEFYPGRALKSRSVLANGQLHGPSEGFYTNGQREVLEPFNAGVSHGTRLKWHPSGARLSEASIVQGKLHGLFRRWHENGQLAEEITLSNGAPTGLSTAYYPSGFLKAQARVQDGRPLEQKSFEDGQTRTPTPASGPATPP